MLKVRLQRVGRRNDPSFRVVVTDSKRGPKSGDYIEMVGNYDPKRKTVKVNGERIQHWMSVGAQVSDTVHNILVREKVISGKAINVLPRKTPIIKESTEEEKASTQTPTAEVQAETPNETVEKVEEESPTTEAPVEETPAKDQASEETKAEEAPTEPTLEETPAPAKEEKGDAPKKEEAAA